VNEDLLSFNFLVYRCSDELINRVIILNKYAVLTLFKHFENTLKTLDKQQNDHAMLKC